MARWEEALDAVTRAVETLETPAEVSPLRHLPDLATALKNRCACLVALHRRPEALDALTEAVEIYETLVTVWPDDYAALLDESRHMLAEFQGTPPGTPFRPPR